jgi:hypothetical protein
MPSTHAGAGFSLFSDFPEKNNPPKLLNTNQYNGFNKPDVMEDIQWEKNQKLLLSCYGSS